MQLGQDTAQLARDAAARLLVAWRTQQLARDRRAADAFHQVAIADTVFGLGDEERLRCRHAMRPSGTHHRELGGAIDRRRLPTPSLRHSKASRFFAGRLLLLPHTTPMGHHF